jgi:hypothetical protein
MIKIEKKIPRVRSSSRVMSCSRLDGASLLCSSPPQPPKALYILDEERSICLLSKVRNYYIGLKNKENIHHCCYKYPVYHYTFIKIAHHYFYKKKDQNTLIHVYKLPIVVIPSHDPNVTLSFTFIH